MPRVAGVLEALGVRWVVAGAVAAAEYRAEPRFTTDLDLLVEWHPDLPAACESAGYDVRAIAAPGEEPHLLILWDGSERIDLLVAVVAYQHEALRRGEADRVLTVEDVIVHKLIAGRPRDRDDLRSILATGTELDADYVEGWAEAWDVLAAWRAISTFEEG